jgi:hypothetical protein
MLKGIKLFILIILCSLCQVSSGQMSEYQNLLDSAIAGSGTVFVYSKPIIVDHLEAYEMEFYAERYWEDTRKRLDTVMFSQIIRNAKNSDITTWKESELPKFLIIHSVDENVSVKTLIKKLGLSDLKQIAFYKKLIHHFNNTSVMERVIIRYSRPVFDDSKKYAIIQWDNGGGGGITLYHLNDNGAWETSGNVSFWRY